MSAIISSCPVRTGSTLLVNALHRFIDPINVQHGDIIKSHILDFSIWENYSKKYNIEFFYISRERSDINHLLIKNMLPSKILIFQYEELLETRSYTLKDIVNNLFDKLRLFLPDSYILNKDSCLQRLIDMNKKVEEIKNKPFSYWDRFYLVHGSHRNRNNKKY